MTTMKCWSVFGHGSRVLGDEKGQYLAAEGAEQLHSGIFWYSCGGDALRLHTR